MGEITYCTNTDCCFCDCKRHWSRLTELAKMGVTHASLQDFSGICRRYIMEVIDIAEKNNAKSDEEYE